MAKSQCLSRRSRTPPALSWGLVHLEDEVDAVSVSVIEHSVPHEIIDFPGVAGL